MNTQTFRITGLSGAARVRELKQASRRYLTETRWALRKTYYLALRNLGLEPERDGVQYLYQFLRPLSPGQLRRLRDAIETGTLLRDLPDLAVTPGRKS